MSTKSNSLQNLMVNHATIMGFIVEGFHDAASVAGRSTEKLYTATSEALETGVDSLYSMVALKVALPLTICLITADRLNMEYPGVFMYEVASTGMGGEMFQAMHDGSFEKFVGAVSDDGVFHDGKDNFILQTVLDFFYGGCTQEVDAETFRIEVQKDYKEFIELL